MYERIIEIFDQASQDKQLVLLSMTGKVKFYSAGTDLAEFAKMAVRDFIWTSFFLNERYSLLDINNIGFKTISSTWTSFIRKIYWKIYWFS